MTTAFEFPGSLLPYLSKYEYQPALTGHLDAEAGQPIDQIRLNEIVLWKLNRYVTLTAEGREAIEAARHIAPHEHGLAERPLRMLLGLHGVDLPMASTILRFANPNAFQIIDRHAYRAIYGRSYPLTPASNANRKVALYFQYLDHLHDLCRSSQLAFETIDRLLYVFDRDVNGSLSE